MKKSELIKIAREIGKDRLTEMIQEEIKELKARVTSRDKREFIKELQDSIKEL